MRLPRVYPIVDSAAWVRRLAPLGVHLVQLRIKEQPRDGLLEEIREAKACCTSSGMQLVINDYWELALVAGCDFVHLGQGDLEGADVPALRRGDDLPEVPAEGGGQAVSRGDRSASPCRC